MTILATSSLGVAKARALLKRLRTDTSGISLVEFAVIAPIFLTMGMMGFEIANMATTKMRVSQVALSLADNASRLGQTDNSAVTPTITEADVTAVLQGALRQGRSINLENQGRVIISSLEYDDPSEKQFIHWQRCVGAKDVDSAYGNDTNDNGLTGDELDGMGQGTNTITALSGSAVMYVEIYYDYENLFATPFGAEASFRDEAAFIIRDDRNLTNGLSNSGTVSDCD